MSITSINQETPLVNEEQLFPVQLKPMETVVEGKFLEGTEPVWVKVTNFHHHPDPCQRLNEE